MSPKGEGLPGYQVISFSFGIDDGAQVLHTLGLPYSLVLQQYRPWAMALCWREGCSTPK